MFKNMFIITSSEFLWFRYMVVISIVGLVRQVISYLFVFVFLISFSILYFVDMVSILIILLLYS